MHFSWQLFLVLHIQLALELLIVPQLHSTQHKQANFSLFLISWSFSWHVCVPLPQALYARRSIFALSTPNSSDTISFLMATVVLTSRMHFLKVQLLVLHWQLTCSSVCLSWSLNTYWQSDWGKNAKNIEGKKCSDDTYAKVCGGSLTGRLQGHSKLNRFLFQWMKRWHECWCSIASCVGLNGWNLNSVL